MSCAGRFNRKERSLTGQRRMAMQNNNFLIAGDQGLSRAKTTPAITAWINPYTNHVSTCSKVTAMAL